MLGVGLFWELHGQKGRTMPQQTDPTSPGISAYLGARYAFPFYESTPSGTGAPTAVADRRINDWKKAQLGPTPAPRNNGAIDLAEIIGPEGVSEIEDLGEIRFHALGDSGVGHADEAEQVAEEMATDFKPGAGALNPAFLFHLGDVVYGPMKTDHYGERFYRPYRRYPGKIIAIPGNHDGEAKNSADLPSLNHFEPISARRPPKSHSRPPAAVFIVKR